MDVMKIMAFLKSFPRKLVIRWLRSSGYSPHFAPIVLDKWYEDIFRNKKTTIPQKLWAQKRGFLSDAVSFYSLTDSNYTEYLSDFNYYLLHPINGAYSKWIDDKLTIKYILQPFSEYLPDYYYHIYDKEILRLMDCPDGYGQTIGDIIKLLKDKGSLAAKLISGAKGEGFYKLAYRDQNFSINNQLSSGRDLEVLINTWLEMKNVEYVITEYLQAHHELRKIWELTPNTLRIMVIREKDQIPKIVSSFIRFGTNISGVIDSQGAGSVSCLVDVKTGCFSDGKILLNYVMTDCKFHPDSKVLLEGVIPNWSIVREKIIQISSFIPQVAYMGYDVIITDDGFKIIEVNSHQGIKFIQYYHPLLKDDMSENYFHTLLEEKKARLKKKIVTF